MMLDIDESKYLTDVQAMIVYLKHSILRKGLTHYSEVPLSALMLTYTSSIYNTVLDVMNFEVQGKRMQISKSTFYKLIGLRTVKIIPIQIYLTLFR